MSDLVVREEGCHGRSTGEESSRLILIAEAARVAARLSDLAEEVWRGWPRARHVVSNGRQW